MTSTRSTGLPKFERSEQQCRALASRYARRIESQEYPREITVVTDSSNLPDAAEAAFISSASMTRDTPEMFPPDC